MDKEKTNNGKILYISGCGDDDAALAHYVFFTSQ